MRELYRVCETRKEAEGLLAALADAFDREPGLLLRLYEIASGQAVGLLYNPNLDESDEHGLLADVEVRLRESRVTGKFQLTVRCKNRAHRERVRAVLNRHRGRRIERPQRGT